MLLQRCEAQNRNARIVMTPAIDVGVEVHPSINKWICNPQPQPKRARARDKEDVIRDECSQNSRVS